MVMDWRELDITFQMQQKYNNQFKNVYIYTKEHLMQFANRHG